MPWAEVDDLTQQGILVALELSPHYQPERGVPFHLFVKPRVFGSMIDMLRHSGSLRRHETEYWSREPEHEAIDDAVDLLVKVENAEILATEIDRLPDQERAVISLFYYDELTNREIAGILGMTEVQAVRLRQKVLATLARSIAQRVEAVPKHVRTIGKCRV